MYDIIFTYGPAAAYSANWDGYEKGSSENEKLYYKTSCDMRGALCAARACILFANGRRHGKLGHRDRAGAAADIDLSGVTLIYPAGDKAASACAKELQHGIAELTGTLPFCLPDSQKTSDECADGAVILVGSTDFPESREAYENLKYGDCTVTAAGRRIVVATASDSALKRRVRLSASL